MSNVDFPDNPVVDQTFVASAKSSFVWRTNQGRWRRTMPGPVITQLIPDETPTGAAVAMTVIGANFTANSKVYINNVLQSTTFVSDTRLDSLAPRNDIPWTVVPVTVVDGPMTSNAMPFTYISTAGPLWLTSIDPTAVFPDANAAITAYGTGFTVLTRWNWNGFGTFKSATLISATQTNLVLDCVANNLSNIDISIGAEDDFTNTSLQMLHII